MDKLENILKKCTKTLPIYDSINEFDNGKTELEIISFKVTGPVIVSYVFWILKDAIKNNISRIYFLARDGYLLKSVAEIFCEKFNLDIECRYLYCSRISLRTPTYYFIGDEAYDLLMLGGYNVTPYSLLERVGFSESEREYLYKKCNIDINQEHVCLSKKKLHEVSKILKKDSVYIKKVEEVSKSKFPNTIHYFKQEGLMDIDTVAIVDSGWTGSMQRSIRQLLNKSGVKPKIVGYYFGLYDTPNDEKDGIYKAWCFSKNSELKFKSSFCNNLFECMLSAPHGMTIDYVYEENKYVPVLGTSHNEKMLKKIEEQQNAVLSFTKEAIKRIDFNDFNPEIHRKITKEILGCLMKKPTKGQVEAFKDFAFNDDILDDSKNKIVSKQEIKYLNKYLLFNRILKKYLKKNNCEKELFWVYGTIAFLPKYKRIWYRFNINIWELLKYCFR